MIRRMLCICLISIPGTSNALESSDCLILPGKEVAIGATIPGLLADVAVDLGDRVEEGQLVARLSTEVQEAVLEIAKARAANTAALETARARLAFETQELERAENLRNRRVVSQQVLEERRTAYEIRLREVEEAEAEVAMAALDVVRAEAEIRVRKIWSPISGVVTERALDPGEYLRDDGSVVTIAQLHPLEVKVFLPQEAHPRIAVGDAVEVSSSVFPDQSHAATVSVIDPVIDAASATFGVRLDLPNPEGDITAGTQCVARFARPPGE